MAKDDLKDIENLSPEERIKKLKEIEEKNKKEIEQAHVLIKESEEEIAIEEKLKHVKPPEMEEVNVNKLFNAGEDLEGTVKAEKIKVSQEELKQQQQYLHELPTQQIEQKATYIQQQVQDTGYMSNEQKQEMSNIYQEIKEREEGIKQGSYTSTSHNIEHQLTVAKRIAGATLSELYKR
tara:strand:- start:163 stop:699 length:537 start_codon:yes stop_codon:yes gene_type:complete